MTVAGRDPRHHRPYVDILFLALKGGSGATWGADGYDHIGLINCGGGLLAQDYEMFELQDPHVLIRHEYATDFAGAGRWRGGLGVVTEFRIEGEDVTGIVFGDGIDEDARGFGIFGGTAGSLNQILITDPDGKSYQPRSKEIVRGIRRGSVVFQHAGGGGGYGNPHDRPIDQVLQDVRNGYVSADCAKRHYGVVIDAATLEVDLTATKLLRKVIV